MKIGYFTSIEGWGGSEMYLLRLMQGVRERGHDVLLFGVAGTRLWEEAGEAGIPRVAWRSVAGFRLQVAGGRTEDGGQRTEDGLETTDNRLQSVDSDNYAVIEDLRSLPSAVCRLSSNSTSLQSSVCGLQSWAKHALLKLMPEGIKLLAGNVREVLHLRRLFKAHLVDVMHVSISGYEVAGLAAKWVGIPCLGMNEIMPEESAGVLRRWMTRWTARKYDIVVAASSACSAAWAVYCDLVPARCAFVWHGTDLERFRPAPPLTGRTRSGPFKLISVGRLHAMKGFNLLLNALSKVRDQSVLLTIVGDGPEHVVLRSRCSELGLENRVTFAGHVADPLPFLQNADCFVMVSVSHESFCIALAEAMACGLPIITSDFGPLPELNQQGVTGIVVPVGDADALAAAIDRLAADSGDCRCFGEAAASRAHEKFGSPEMVQRMIALYIRIDEACMRVSI